MTELDTLKALLDQRGEPYVENDFGVTWRYGSDPHTATESMDGTLIVTGLTARQAIEAMLGRGECHDTSKYSNSFACSKCGEETDFLTTHGGPRFCPRCGRVVDNPKVGIAYVEEYEDYDEHEGSYDRYECGECGAYLTDSIMVQVRGEQIPDTCPRCGRKLVR